MKIEDISGLWDEDSKTDITDLSNESIKLAKLHNKYYQIFYKERLLLRKYESEYKQLRLEKYEFYTQGPNKESIEKGWKLPAKGMILKSDIPMYIEADQDIINLSLKIGLQQEKVDYLDSIIKFLVPKGFHIKAAIEFEKFKNGA